jgi:hypothetical protein
MTKALLEPQIMNKIKPPEGRPSKLGPHPGAQLYRIIVIFALSVNSYQTTIDAHEAGKLSAELRPQKVSIKNRRFEGMHPGNILAAHPFFIELPIEEDHGPELFFDITFRLAMSFMVWKQRQAPKK